MSIILNTALSSVRSVSILQFFEHFQLIFDISNVNNDKQIKQKIGELFFWNLFRIIKFFFLILLREVTLESKIATTNRNISAFLLYTSKTFPNVENVVFHFFTNFFGTNFRHQNKNSVVETISCFVFKLSKKYCVYYVSEHLKYCSQINEYWLNKNACVNIV